MYVEYIYSNLDSRSRHPQNVFKYLVRPQKGNGPTVFDGLRGQLQWGQYTITHDLENLCSCVTCFHHDTTKLVWLWPRPRVQSDEWWLTVFSSSHLSGIPHHIQAKKRFKATELSMKALSGHGRSQKRASWPNHNTDRRDVTDDRSMDEPAS